MLLREIFDTKATIIWHNQSNRMWDGDFRVGGTAFRIAIRHDSDRDHWSFNFFRADGTSGVLPGRPGEQEKPLQVYGTVLEALRQFLRDQQPKKVIFFAPTDAQSAVYQKMLQSNKPAIQQMGYSVETNGEYFELMRVVSEAKIVNTAFLHVPTGRIMGIASNHAEGMFDTAKELGFHDGETYDDPGVEEALDKLYDMRNGDELIDGFVSDDGKFYTREEAAKLVKLDAAKAYPKGEDSIGDPDRNWLDSWDIEWGNYSDVEFEHPIREAFDTPVRTIVTADHAQKYVAKFQLDGIVYDIYAQPDGEEGVWEFGFGEVTRGKDYKLAPTRDKSPKHALTVFSTVLRQMVDFLRKKKPREVVLAPASDEQRAVYDRILRRPDVTAAVSGMGYAIDHVKNPIGGNFVLRQNTLREDAKSDLKALEWVDTMRRNITNALWNELGEKDIDAVDLTDLEVPADAPQFMIDGGKLGLPKAYLLAVTFSQEDRYTASGLIAHVTTGDGLKRRMIVLFGRKFWYDPEKTKLGNVKSLVGRSEMVGILEHELQHAYDMGRMTGAFDSFKKSKKLGDDEVVSKKARWKNYFGTGIENNAFFTMYAMQLKQAERQIMLARSYEEAVEIADLLNFDLNSFENTFRNIVKSYATSIQRTFLKSMPPEVYRRFTGRLMKIWDEVRDRVRERFGDDQIVREDAKGDFEDYRLIRGYIENLRDYIEKISPRVIQRMNFEDETTGPSDHSYAIWGFHLGIPDDLILGFRTDGEVADYGGEFARYKNGKRGIVISVPAENWDPSLTPLRNLRKIVADPRLSSVLSHELQHYHDLTARPNAFKDFDKKMHRRGETVPITFADTGPEAWKNYYSYAVEINAFTNAWGAKLERALHLALQEPTFEDAIEALGDNGFDINSFEKTFKTYNRQLNDDDPVSNYFYDSMPPGARKRFFGRLMKQWDHVRETVKRHFTMNESEIVTELGKKTLSPLKQHVQQKRQGFNDPKKEFQSYPDREALRDFMARYGAKPLGSGGWADTWEVPGKPYVIKTFGIRDTAYLGFLEFVAQDPVNPLVPRLWGRPYRIPGTEIAVIKVERLNEPSLQLGDYVKKFPQLGVFLQKLSRRGEKLGHKMDIGLESMSNFMVRADGTPVITDPWYRDFYDAGHDDLRAIVQKDRQAPPKLR